MTPHILVVEDEAAIRTLLQFNLERAGFAVSTADNAAQARFRLNGKLPDLMLLDWMLPDSDGVEFARSLRQEQRTRDLPVILLTARGTEEDKEHGLMQGADDYVTKPFSVRELTARIHALLRRRKPQKSAESIRIGRLHLDPEHRRLHIDGQAAALGPSEFRLLHFFMTHPERIYSRRELLDLVWGDHVYLEERTIDVHIRRLRQSLEPQQCGHLIETVRGAGYRFNLPEKQQAV